MRTVILAIAVLGTSGCLRQTAFHCESSADCIKAGVQGTCEGTNFCSFDDASCPEGRRYGDLSGSYSSTCVDLGVPGDAGPDAPVSTVDTDSDGIADSADNCPAIANANQNNEDGDRFGDVCDPCPPVSGDTPVDGDGDGVADDCDPHPATGGDQITLFEGFKQGIPATWTKTGTWTETGDDAAGDSLAGLISLEIPTAVIAHEAITASLVVDSLAATNSSGGGLSLMGDAQDTVSCATFRRNDTQATSLFLSDGASLPVGAQYQFAAGTTYTMRELRDLTSYTCGATASAGLPLAANITGTSNVTSTQPLAGVGHFGAVAHVQWVMIVSSP